MTRASRDDVKQRLRAAGLRATAPRVAVLRLLGASARPLSHSEVVAAIGSDDYDPATLYRNLQKLVEAGFARVASKVDGIARYALQVEGDSPHEHPHFSCRVCGEVACLPGAKLGGTVEPRWHSAVQDAELQLVGCCPKCLSRNNKSRTGRRSKAVAPRRARPAR